MGLGRLRLCAPVLLTAAGSLAQADTIYSNSFDTAPTGGEWSKTTASTTVSPFGSFLGRFERETVTLTLGSIDPPDGGGGGDNGGGGDSGGSGGIVSGGKHSPIDNFRDGRGGGLGGGFHAFKSRPITGGGGGGGGGDNSGGGDNGGGGPGDNLMAAGSYTLTFDLYLFDTWDGRDPTFGTDSFKVNVNGVTLFNEVLETFEPWENRLAGWEIAGSAAYNSNYRDILYRNLSLNFSLAEAGLIVADFISLQNQGLYDECWGLDNVRVAYNGRSMAVPAPAGVLALGGLLGWRRRR